MFLNHAKNLYSISLPVLQKAIIKYRYLRKGSADNFECDPDGQIIQYRSYFAAAPGDINDVVINWSDHPLAMTGGTITGRIMDQDTHQPAGETLVSAAGKMTRSDSLGNYTLNNVPIGLQNILLFSLNGTYFPYQQGAKVLANATTYADITVIPSQQVNLTFMVSPPPDMPKNNPPIRFLGNMLDLGDTFAQLKGGVSIDPLRAPVLLKLPDGHYALTLKLPAGFDLHYKYSLGDGFWNAEHTLDGHILTREIIIPDQDTTITDQIAAWGIPGISPVQFDITIPENTPADSSISIQLSPFVWMEPLPMQPSVSNHANQWNVTLFPPMAGFSKIDYQFCHDSICGSNKSSGPSSSDSSGVAGFTFGDLPQNLSRDIYNWTWWNNPSIPVNLSADEVVPRGRQFIAAVEIAPAYSQDQLAQYTQSIQHIRQLGANWVFLTPQWTWTRQNPPIAESSINNGIYEPDLSKLTQLAVGQGLSVAYYPLIVYPQSPNSWWENNPHDAAWWNGWFISYQAFILDQAAQAEKNHAGMLIMGGPEAMPAMPGGLLKNGSSSGVSPDAFARWQNIITGVRNIYHGPLVWAVSNDDLANTPWGLIANTDGVYLLYSANLLDEQNKLTSDRWVESLNQFKIFNKPILVGIDYPSSPGAEHGCVWGYSSSCWTLNNDQVIDQNQQSAIYKMFFAALNQDSGISGVVTRGFSPSGPRLDSSSSIHGKSASALVWYWYSRWVVSP